MVTLLQQLLGALLTLLFGLLSYGVVRRERSRAPGRFAAAWKITGAYFLLVGAYALVHSCAAIFAVRAGPESELYEHVIRWGAAANAARALATIGFAGLLLYAQTGGVDRARSNARASLPLLLCLVVLGSYAADHSSLVAFHRQASVLAVLAAATSILLLIALLLALARDGMDEVLWLALTAYALKEVLSVSLFAIMAWVTVTTARETVRVFYSISVAVMLGMCLAAAWRLRQAAAGRRVPSLLERVRAVRPPVMGWDRLG